MIQVTSQDPVLVVYYPMQGEAITTKVFNIPYASMQVIAGVLGELGNAERNSNLRRLSALIRVFDILSQVDSIEEIIFDEEEGYSIVRKGIQNGETETERD